MTYGAGAQLSEAGYQSLANRRDTSAMRGFIERIIAEAGGGVTLPDELNKLAPWHSGEKAVQSLHELCAELKTKTWISWPDPMSASSKLDDIAAGRYAGAAAGAAAGGAGGLTEAAYQQLASQRSTPSMCEFIERVVTEAGGRVTAPAELYSWAQWFSGEKSVQSLRELCQQLRGVNWVSWTAPMMVGAKLDAIASGGGGAASGRMPTLALGETAPITEAGYQQVAASRDSAQMCAFITRVAEAAGGRVTDQGALRSMAPWYSGEKSVQTLRELCNDLKTKAFLSWANPMMAGSTLDSLAGASGGYQPQQQPPQQQQQHRPAAQPAARPTHGVSGYTAQLSEAGYQQVAALRDTEEMVHFGQRIVQHAAHTALDAIAHQRHEVFQQHHAHMDLGGMGFGMGAALAGMAGIAGMAAAAAFGGSPAASGGFAPAGRCVHCHGRGWAHESQMPHDKGEATKCFFCTQCSTCNGTGQCSRPACHRCLGRGWEHSSDMPHDKAPDEKCFFCSHCSQCHGSGTAR